MKCRILVRSILMKVLNENFLCMCEVIFLKIRAIKIGIGPIMNDFEMFVYKL